MSKGHSLPTISLFLFVLCAASLCSAAWIENGVLVCGEINRQFRQQMVADGHGGAVVAWIDERSGTSDLYAQRMDDFGFPLWQPGGVPVCTAVGSQSYLKMAPDASGGAIAVWIDARAGGQRLYMQRIDGSGVSLWEPDGILLSGYFVQVPSVSIVPDGNGGAIVSWGDKRNGDYDIFAQRIDADGTMLWGAEGISVSTGPMDQYAPALLAEEVGGAIITWRDNRTGTTTYRAQRIDAGGARLWTADSIGVPCGAAATPSAMAADGAGGAFIAGLTYVPGHNVGDFDNILSVWRLGADGAQRWSSAVTVADSTWEYPTPGLVSDGSGGAIVVWDFELIDGNGNIDIGGQRLDSLGTALWGEAGIVICDRTGSQTGPHIDSDGAGGAVISYQDNSVYAQRIDANGIILWESNGVPLCSGTAAIWPIAAEIVSDGAGGAIAAWYDIRDDLKDIYAARVDAWGNEPITGVAATQPPMCRLRQNYPNPFNPSTTITFDLDKASRAKLCVYDASGRLTAVLLDRTLGVGRHEVTWNGEDRAGREAASGIYFCRLTAGGRPESIPMVLAR